MRHECVCVCVCVCVCEGCCSVKVLSVVGPSPIPQVCLKTEVSGCGTWLKGGCGLRSCDYHSSNTPTQVLHPDIPP